MLRATGIGVRFGTRTVLDEAELAVSGKRVRVPREELVAVAGAGLLMAWPVGQCSLPGAAATVALASAPRYSGVPRRTRPSMPSSSLTKAP